MIYALDNVALLSVEGPDSDKFLQGQLSCDMNNVTARQGCFAIYADLKGRVVATLHVCKLAEKTLLIVAADLLDVVADTLAKYAVFSKVTISKETSYHIYGASNPQGKEVGTTTATAAGCELVIAAQPHLAWLISPEALPTEGTQQQWQQQLITAALPLIQSATSATFVPQRLNLDSLGALNFNKGCYLGQEIIARLHYRGKVKYHCYPFAINTTAQLAPGQTLATDTDKNWGQIVEAVEIETGIWHALVVIPDANNTLTTCELGELKRLPLPYELKPKNSS